MPEKKSPPDRVFAEHDPFKESNRQKKKDFCQIPALPV